MCTCTCVATALILYCLQYCAVDVVSFMLQLNDYIQVASGVPRPVRSKGTEAVEAQVTAHAEWCRRILNTGGQLFPCHHTLCCVFPRHIVPGTNNFDRNYLEKNCSTPDIGTSHACMPNHHHVLTGNSGAGSLIQLVVCQARMVGDTAVSLTQQITQHSWSAWAMPLTRPPSSAS